MASIISVLGWLSISSIIIIVIIVTQIFQQFPKSSSNTKTSNLPPGKTGWPLLGETLAYVFSPENFIFDRMKKYSPHVFKTSLAGEKTAVFCGPLANKFIFSNEGKLVKYWLPRSVSTPLSYRKTESNSPSGKPTHDLSYQFLKVESIQHYVSMVDSMTRQHLDKYWAPFLQVKAYNLAKEFTLALSCRILVNCSIDDPNFDLQVRELAEPFFLEQGIRK